MAVLRLYMAGPLFSQVERRWNRQLAQLLAERIPGVEVTLPQDFRIGGRFNNPRYHRTLHERCVEAIDAADVVVAILDGPDADSGTAFEVGYARALRKPIVGVRTDFRQSQDRGVNIMLRCACTRYVFDMSFNEDPGQLASRIARAVKSVCESGGSPLTER
jgi:nucleoside 2-deoxyribosyltransferase